MKKCFIAGASHAEFLRRYWQKKPLFARAALHGFADAVTREELFELAARDDIESRLVSRTHGQWQVRHGPFTRNRLRKLPRSGWTLLVQGVDAARRQAARLLESFSFIPYARLDDLMVSYAVPGGGVGPHFDTYDVFLVQGMGERRWRLSAQRDLELVADAPLKLLQKFEAAREYTVAAGDVLYLPPRYAHDGVALTECMTYSVGFRAPAAHELGSRFLEFLQDRLTLEGIYADPGLEPTRRPGRIPLPMLEACEKTLRSLRWSRADIAEFLGRYLTEPKAHVVFKRPQRALGPEPFARSAQRAGVRLSLPSRMLFDARRIFMNGECARATAAAGRALRRLADARELRPPLELGHEARALLYEWYRAGYIEIGS